MKFDRKTAFVKGPLRGISLGGETARFTRAILNIAEAAFVTVLLAIGMTGVVDSHQI